MTEKKKKELLRKRGLSRITKEIENLDKFFTVCYPYPISLTTSGKWACTRARSIITDDLRSRTNLKQNAEPETCSMFISSRVDLVSTLSRAPASRRKHHPRHPLTLNVKQIAAFKKRPCTTKGHV